MIVSSESLSESIQLNIYICGKINEKFVVVITTSNPLSAKCSGFDTRGAATRTKHLSDSWMLVVSLDVFVHVTRMFVTTPATRELNTQFGSCLKLSLVINGGRQQNFVIISVAFSF